MPFFCLTPWVAIAAAIVDVQQHRIPNWLTYPAMIAGILLRFFFFGWKGALASLAGLFLAGGIVFLFYMVRAMGAGDVKLLAALGALIGPRYVITTMAATALFGGVLALVYAAYSGRVRTTVANVGSVLKFHLWGGLQAHPEVNLDNPQALRMPYGLAIAMGALYTFVATCRR